MKPVLKYLFAVEYSDGEIYRQTPDDLSKIDEKRSEYFDVLQEVEKGRTIRRFSLVGDGNTVTVDLLLGIFYVNGLAVLLEGEKLPGIPDKFDLIFYRQWTHDLGLKIDKKSGKLLDMSHKQAYCEYFIGWECELGGKKYKQKMAVA